MIRDALALLFGLVLLSPAGAEEVPAIVGHRGLFHQAPENTLATFAACIELRIGFELDVRRSRDGQLICIHDADLKRTTDGQGPVAERTLADLRKLDAGRWFDPAFAGQRIPTLAEVFGLLKERQSTVLVALDLKDADVEADVVKLARQHGVLGQVVCIGRAITLPEVRRQLRQTDAKVPVAVLAPAAAELAQALADPHADWVYVRFLPTPAQVKQVHQAGKRLFLSGPLVQGREPENWRKARDAGVDALLTDYPLECRESWRTLKK
jgi:glycerophosphoryl diester phosphodiesterase